MLILLLTLALCYFSRICAGSSIEILFKQAGKIVDRAKSQHICDLTDRVLILADQLLTFLELDIEQIILWRGIQMSFKQSLQRGA